MVDTLPCILNLHWSTSPSYCTSAQGGEALYLSPLALRNHLEFIKRKPTIKSNGPITSSTNSTLRKFPPPPLPANQRGRPTNGGAKRKIKSRNLSYKMSFFTQLRLKLGEVFGKYSSLFAKEGTCARGSRDRTGPANLCLSCQAVWIRGPHDLCTNCKYFH